MRVLDTASVSSGTSGASDWQLQNMELPLAWQVTRGSSRVVVAVVDSGVQADHPDLNGRVLPGVDLVNHDADASDDNGHGTAVAGVIAGGTAADGSVGVCPQCLILPIKVLGANGTGDWGTVAAGIVWAADHGASVINVSFGAPRAPDPLDAAIAYALAKGAIIVAAAGNDGANEPFYPAQDPGVISVAGIDPSDNRYSWSNYGTWVSVAAPGCTRTTWVGGGYDASFCGTSAAAPFVSGLAGLARSYRPDLAAGAFADSLGSSARPLADGGATASGGVDANGLLVALGAPSAPPVSTSPPSINNRAVVGRMLVARPGGWKGASSVTYRWQRSVDGTTWHDVGKGVSYTARVSDRGGLLHVVVTASNSRGSALASSAPTAVVTAARVAAHGFR